MLSAHIHNKLNSLFFFLLLEISFHIKDINIYIYTYKKRKKEKEREE